MATPSALSPARSSRTALLAVLLLVGGACDRAAPPTSSGVRPPDVSQYVTGEAAAALSANGLFRDAGPSPERARDMISRDAAREQALAYVRTFGQFFHRSWEKQAGRSIHLPSLHADARVDFVDTPYGRFPEGPFHPAFRKIFGPAYLVTLTDGRSPVLLVGVSAFNTDVTIDERGRVIQPAVGGNDFTSFAIASDTNAYLHLTPERAVERVGRTTGARVTRAPERVMMSAFDHVAISVWRLPLDREVRVRARAGGEEKTARELYLNGLGQYLVPAERQPQGHTEHFPVGPPWDPGNRRVQQATVPLRPGHGTEWVQVVVAAGA